MLLTKKLLILLFLFFYNISNFAYSYKPDSLPIYIYKEGNIYAKDAFFVPSNWIGDFLSLETDLKSKTNPKNGNNCMKLQYNRKRKNKFGWAAIGWVFPSYNWGNINGAINLKDAKKVTFWARGKKGGEILIFQLGGNYGYFSDTGIMTYGPIAISSKWKLYSFSLKGEDLSHISIGFQVTIDKNLNKNNFENDVITVYLDDIKIE